MSVNGGKAYALILVHWKKNASIVHELADPPLVGAETTPSGNPAPGEKISKEILPSKNVTQPE